MTYTKPMIIAIGKHNVDDSVIKMLKVGYANLMIKREFIKASVIFGLVYRIERG